MTTNRSNIGTSGYGSDIFLVGTANSPFTNLGELTTSGDFASPMKATADGVTLINKGSLITSGDGSYGIFAGDLISPHYDNVTVVNYGSISTSGDFLDDGTNFAFGADGIEQNGNNGIVKNYGSISTAGIDSAGINHIGANSTILNYGTIDSAGIGIVVDTIDGTETGNAIINYGRIHTTADSSHAILILAENNVIKNYGFIQADGFNGFGLSMEAGGNHAENYGTILVTGEIGRGVLLLGEGNSFDNYGLVRATGEGGLGVRFSGENPLGSDGGVFTNYGKVEGAARSVSGVDSDDHVVNRGVLVGDVSLGAGSDSYVAGKNSSLDGVLKMGDGDDLIVFEKGAGKLTVADFTVGAATDDVIDLSGLGYHSLADVLSHASQSGADVVLKFSAKDQIVLQNVDLASLTADDFSFAPSSLLQIGLAGAHVSHGDFFLG